MVRYYDHPILWSEDRKRFEERLISDRGLREWRAQKRLERLNRVREQQEYSEMIAKYNPWGKMGGGAPNKSIRMRNIRLDGLYPDYKNDFRNPVLAPYKIRGGGGGGAPIRSASGRLITSYHDDPILSFNDPNRYHVDIELRYKKTKEEQDKYRKELDKMVAEKQNERFRHGLGEQGQWGKAGPGGAPWRPPKNIGQNFMHSMGWTTNEGLRRLDNEVKRDANMPEEPKPKKVTKKQNSPRKSECCPKCSCECLKSFEEYIGASYEQPARNPNPYKQKTSPKNTGIPKKSKRTLKKQMNANVELVPLLAKRRGDPRNINLSTTDVTKMDKFDPGWKECNVDHLSTLCRQIKQKQKAVKFSHDQDVETSRRHFETWSSFWGRPGHGAPREIKNKLNLDNLLYKLPL